MRSLFKVPPPVLQKNGGGTWPCTSNESPLADTAAVYLEVNNLTRMYPGERGLLPTSFNVDKGESIAIVGHNGAGKSTLLKMLAGWVIADSGFARIEGIDINNCSTSANKPAFVPEKPNLFDFFSVQYNLKLFARLFQVTDQRVEQTLQQLDLIAFRRSRVEVLSKGLKQRVSIGRALLANPPVLLLDEPTSGLDYEMTRQIYHLLGDIHRSGKTILFTSHRPEEMKTLATRIIAIHKGKVVFDGIPLDYFKSSIHEQLYA